MEKNRCLVFLTSVSNFFITQKEPNIASDKVSYFMCEQFLFDPFLLNHTCVSRLVLIFFFLYFHVFYLRLILKCSKILHILMYQLREINDNYL